MINFVVAVLFAGNLMSGDVLSGGAGYMIGQGKYQETCIVCHGEKGKGEFPGIPDFTKKKSSLNKDNVVLIKSIIEGLERPEADIAMPPMGGNPDLTREDVIEILRYMKDNFLKK